MINDKPFFIKVVDDIEHEDGSVTYSFDLDEVPYALDLVALTAWENRNA